MIIVFAFCPNKIPTLFDHNRLKQRWVVVEHRTHTHSEEQNIISLLWRFSIYKRNSECFYYYFRRLKLSIFVEEIKNLANANTNSNTSNKLFISYQIMSTIFTRLYYGRKKVLLFINLLLKSVINMHYVSVVFGYFISNSSFVLLSIFFFFRLFYLTTIESINNKKNLIDFSITIENLNSKI